MKTFRMLILATALGFSIPAHAVLPMVDMPKLQVMIQENMQRGMESAKKMLIVAEDMYAKGQNTAMEIDNKNNAVANVIARKGAELQEVLRLEQLSRSAPAQAVCSTLSLSHNLDQALCNEEAIRDIIRKSLASSNPSPMEIHASNTDESGSRSSSGSAGGGKLTPFKPGEGVALTATAQAWEDLNQEQEDAIDRIIEESWGTEDGPPTDPSLLVINGIDTYQYTEEQLNKVLDMSKIVYPYYVRQKYTDPVNEREAIREERSRAINDLGNSIIQRQIAMRSSPSEDTPSMLLSMAMPVELVFEGLDDGEEISANPAHERMRLATGSDVGVGEISRAQLLNKAVKVNQMIESWKSMLIREQALATLLLSRLDPPANQ